MERSLQVKRLQSSIEIGSLKEGIGRRSRILPRRENATIGTDLISAPGLWWAGHREEDPAWWQKLERKAARLKRPYDVQVRVIGKPSNNYPTEVNQNG